MSDAFTRLKNRISEGYNAWLRDSGERSLTAFGTAFMWAGALHAAYVVAVPAPLRASVARRNARLAMRSSLAALLVVGCYDLLQTTRLDREKHELAVQYRALTRAAAALDDEDSSSAPAPDASGGDGGGGAKGGIVIA